MQRIILFIIDFFDYFHKKKILNFLKRNNYRKFDVFFDIGAHKGETIDLFTKNFIINNIYSFEASPINFMKISQKLSKVKKKFYKSEIILENLALGDKKGSFKFNQLSESSSSTLNEINTNSSYFKKKKKIFKLFIL